MSRLWDTPEFWARREADEMLREMADSEPRALADSLERSAANYDSDPELAAAIIADLRKRAAAGVRFWTGPRLVAVDQESTTGKVEIAELIDDEIPW